MGCISWWGFRDIKEEGADDWQYVEIGTGRGQDSGQKRGTLQGNEGFNLSTLDFCGLSDI